MKKLFLVCAILALATSSRSQTFQWAYPLGQDTFESKVITSTATDSLGNLYCTGYFKGAAHFSASSGAALVTLSTPLYAESAFIAKISSSGSLVWVKKLEDDPDGAMFTPYVAGSSITVDRSGQVYVTGTSGTNLIYHSGNSTDTVYNRAGGTATFIAKMDAAGNVSWIRMVGDNISTTPNSITTDLQGNPILAGYFNGIDFDTDPGNGIHLLHANGIPAGFVLSLDPQGSFRWSKGAVSINASAVFGGLRTTSSGDVILTGYHMGNTIIDTDTLTDNTNNNNVLLVRFAANGNLVSARSYGAGTGRDLATDKQGNIYMAGHNNGKGFIRKLTATGVELWNKPLGTSDNNISAQMIGLDAGNNVYAAGFFQGTIIEPPISGPAQSSLPSWPSMFIAQLDSAGNFTYIRKHGARLSNMMGTNELLNVMNNGDVYLCGSYKDSADMDPGAGSAIFTHPVEAAFVSKLQGCAGTITREPADVTTAVATHAVFAIAAPAGSTFHWQIKTGNTFSDIRYAVDAYADDTNKDTLDIYNLRKEHEGKQFRCIVSAPNGCVSISQTATLHIICPQRFIVQPLPQTVIQGESAQFIAGVSVPMLYLSWDIETDSGAYTLRTKTNVYTFDTLTIPNVPEAYNNRRIHITGLDDFGCLTSSDTVLLQVLACPHITLQPLSDSVGWNDTAIMVVQSSAPGVTYQWQEDAGFAFGDIQDHFSYSGINSDTLFIVHPDGHNRTRYRCIISTGSCADTSHAATLLVGARPDGLNELYVKAQLRIYPNPAGDMLFPETDKEVSYTVSDACGQTLLSGKVGRQQGINLHTLRPGLYILQTNEGSARFIRQ